MPKKKFTRPEKRSVTKLTVELSVFKITTPSFSQLVTLSIISAVLIFILSSHPAISGELLSLLEIFEISTGISI